MSNNSPKCDACGRRVRPKHHELLLSDALTGQVIGHYHARPDCQGAATKYLRSGAVIMATFVHPDRCGPEQEHCDAGLSEKVA